MKYLFFVILFSIFIIGTSKGQIHHSSIDSSTMNFVKELQFKNIDTICIYRDYCEGCGKFITYQEDSVTYFCFHDISTYIFWLDQGKTFISKKDNCFDYSTIEIDSTSLWKIFFTYDNQIRKEKVKPFEFTVYKNRKKEVSGISVSSSRLLSFEIVVNTNITSMHFDEFDLEKEHRNNLNINYSHNWNLKGKKIIDELKRLVQQIENEKMLNKNWKKIHLISKKRYF